MATENQSRPAVTPFAAAPQPVMTPFGSSGSVASRPEGVTFRSPSVPPNLVPNGSRPFSSTVPLAKSLSPAFRPSTPGGFVPSTPAPPGQPPSNVPPMSNNFHHFSAPRFPSQPQAPPVGMLLTGPPNMLPSVQPNLLQRPGVPVPTPPVTFSSLPQTPSFQVASPPQASPYFVQQPGNVQPPLQPVFPAIQQPRSAPPTSSMQGLIEDFNSLSLGAVPGSVDSGLNSKAFPRPLDGDVEPNALSEVYPMNCNPRYLRLTTSGIPNSQSLASRWHLPLGAVVCPLAVAPEGVEVPVVNFGSAGIIRCRRCRTYVNPYITFTDGGTKWRCNMCALQNDVSGDYFAQLDPTGRRVDADQRPELTRGSVEFVAPTEYMVRPPMPPLYFFLIDVSVSAVRSGVLEVVAQTIKSCLDELPGFPRTQIGFITYDSNIHFYNMKSTLTQPQMMVISDVEDIFIPLPDDLRVILSESRKVVESFLDSLPSMFQGTTNVESAFGPALRAAFMIMSQLGGKLLIFQNTLPSIGVGRLRLRGDDPVVYDSNKEPYLRVAEDSFYKHMAADFTKYQIGVNVYACSNNYTDLASLGTLSKYTGGQVYHYPSFQSNVQGEKLRHELARDLIRETAWEAVMRIRCGKGVRFNSYHGNFMLRSTDLLALPAVDCDKAFAMQLSLEETLLTTQTVYFQVALLYTASCGERRIRVHTAAAPVISELGEMYRQADTGAIVSLLGRIAIEKSLSGKLEDARNYLQLKIVKSLREYRSLFSVQHRLAGRMIYPESLKYLPLYGLALFKSTALRGGHLDEPLDERCAVGSKMMTLPVKNLLKFLYPSLIRVDDLLLQASSSLKDIEKRLPLAQESLDPRGLYVLDDGFDFVIWIGKFLSSDITTSLNITFDLLECKLIGSGSEMSRRLVRLFNKMRESDPAYYQLSHFVRQGEQHKEMYYLLANLIEDQTRGITGYADWIMLIHRQVLQNA